MKQAIFATIISMNFLSLAGLAQDRGRIVFLHCPGGFLEVGNNLCVQEIATGDKNKIYHKSDRRRTANKTYYEAQASCRVIGGHVCKVDELWAAYDQIKNDLGRQEMIGNYIADDHHLCTNLPQFKDNFDGTCHRDYKLRYRCCLTSPAPVGF